jgi:hypothetical protein
VTNETLGEYADWRPCFLPWFFEPNRRETPELDWHPDQAEIDMRDCVRRDWLRCPECKRYRQAIVGGESLLSTTCQSCRKGKLEAVILEDTQLRWMWK